MIDESCFSAQSGFRHTTKVRACSSTVWPPTMPLRYWTLMPDVILTQNGHSTCLPLLWRPLGGARCTDTTCGSHMLMVASGSLLCLRLRQGVSSLSLSLHNPLDHAAPSISSSIGLPITGPVYSISDLARWWNENRIETSLKSLCCPALARAE